jgi:tRNA/rRNA methyltransferase
MPFIILHKPQLAENTGMAMRAMANTGIRNLRLVSPVHGWPCEKAVLASAEKVNLLNIEIFDSLENAISDLQLVFATSARRRDMIQEIYSPESAVKKILSFKNVGIVFGNEKFGLTNDEMSRCNFAMEIPAVDFSSYNLAQAVLIVCYQIMNAKTKSGVEKKFSIGKTNAASQFQVDYFLDSLEKDLEKRNHFSSKRKHILMMQNYQEFI